MPLAAAIFEIADEFLFLRVDGNDGLGLENALVDEFELGCGRDGRSLGGF